VAKEKDVLRSQIDEVVALRKSEREKFNLDM
jgi:hypothetical protein